MLSFLYKSIEELTQRVSWPSYEKLQRLFLAFLVGVLVVSLLVGGVNVFFEKTSKTVYAKF